VKTEVVAKILREMLTDRSKKGKEDASDCFAVGFSSRFSLMSAAFRGISDRKVDTLLRIENFIENSKRVIPRAALCDRDVVKSFTLDITGYRCEKPPQEWWNKISQCPTALYLITASRSEVPRCSPL